MKKHIVLSIYLLAAVNTPVFGMFRGAAQRFGLFATVKNVKRAIAIPAVTAPLYVGYEITKRSNQNQTRVREICEESRAEKVDFLIAQRELFDGLSNDKQEVVRHIVEREMALLVYKEMLHTGGKAYTKRSLGKFAQVDCSMHINNHFLSLVEQEIKETKAKLDKSQLAKVEKAIEEMREADHRENKMEKQPSMWKLLRNWYLDKTILWRY